jgi:RNA polymerase sigma-70 factor (ECF subfamily)
MEIWEELKKNKELGARRLVDEYGNRLLGAASMLCENSQDAEDLVFRTLEQAIKKIHQFNPEYSFFSWLYTILRNFRKMDLRKRRILVPVGSSEDLPEVPTDSFAEVLGEASDDVLEDALRSLSEPLREAIVLRYYCDKTLAETAAMLNVPEGTVKSRLHNAHNALNRYLTSKRNPRHE